MNKRIKRRLLWLGRRAVFGGCAVVSVFLLMSGYESITNRPLPWVHTIDKVNLVAFSHDYTFRVPPTSSTSSLYGNFGKPSTLKLPEASLRLNIVAPIKQNTTWLARAGTLQLLVPKPPRAGNIGAAFLYCRSSFRTISARNMPTVGQNIFMDTEGSWRYVYRVSSAKQISENQPYVPSDDGTQGKLIVDCNDSGQKVNYIIEGDLLSVQGIQQ